MDEPTVPLIRFEKVTATKYIFDVPAVPVSPFGPCAPVAPVAPVAPAGPAGPVLPLLDAQYRVLLYYRYP